MFHGATRFQLVLALFSYGQLWACTLTGESFDPQVAGASLTAEQDDPVEAITPAPSPMMSEEDAVMCSGSTELAGCEVPLTRSEGECGSDLDCESLVCVSGTCAVASCDDGRRNGDESGIDCGGPCVACDDCALGRCLAPTCEDDVKNQGEAGVDCAGPCALRCGSGESCTSDEDCGPDLFCPEATRQCTAVSCSDVALNGDEVLVDCGGGECPGCPIGTLCSTGADCLELVCGSNGTCAAPTCDDGVKNQDETATDCGGSCAPCPAPEACAVATDCESGVCASGGCSPDVERCCQEPSCDDGLRNGAEPSIDCGDAACGLCENGKPCDSNAVCASASCQAQVCRVNPCEDGLQNGTETDVDCGGTCAACAGLPCGADADCASGACQDGSCCGGELEDCTRCARRLATGIGCGSLGTGPQGNCNGFLQCLANNLDDCTTSTASECSDDPDDVCNHQAFGSYTGAGIILANAILLDAGCQL